MGERRWSQVSAEAQGWVIARLKTELVDLKRDRAAAEKVGMTDPAAPAREEAVLVAIETLYLARVEVPVVVESPAAVEVSAEVVSAAEVVSEIQALPSASPPAPAPGLGVPGTTVTPGVMYVGPLVAGPPPGWVTPIAGPGEGDGAVPARDVRVLDEEGRCLVQAGDVLRHKPTARQDVVMRIEGNFAYFARGGIYKLTELERV